MTIEYDEEVKLHDGEMIWVHITRHYGLSSGVFGDTGGMDSSYKPTHVEISWDTGFEGVGRKSVYFRNVAHISKYDNKWYVFGFMPQGSANKKNGSVSCETVGVKVGKFGCTVVVDSNGLIKVPDSDNNLDWKGWNILYPIGIKDWGSVPRPLEGQRVTWSEKLKLEKTQPQHLRRIDRNN